MARKRSGSWILITILTLSVYSIGSLMVPQLENTENNINNIVVDNTENMVDSKSIASNIGISEDSVIVGGTPIGIYLDTAGVMVIDTQEIQCENGTFCNPAGGILLSDDYIFELNGVEIGSKAQLIELIRHLDGSNVSIGVRRGTEEFYTEVKPVLDNTGAYKLGIWVRDNLQGLGTLTYVDAEGTFGALGHGIHDVDTGELLKINSGELYLASVNGIIKGSNGIPGGLEGLIIYSEQNLIGGIHINSDAGIYGTITHIERMGIGMTNIVETAMVEEIEVGPATILCTIEDKIQEYEIRVTEVNVNETEVNKGLVIEVVDSELIEMTGGIVQGMSGSPILQNGKLIGAVTHVFVNDPTRGYGIFIESMLETAESIND